MCGPRSASPPARRVWWPAATVPTASSNDCWRGRTGAPAQSRSSRSTCAIRSLPPWPRPRTMPPSPPIWLSCCWNKPRFSTANCLTIRRPSRPGSIAWCCARCSPLAMLQNAEACRPEISGRPRGSKIASTKQKSWEALMKFGLFSATVAAGLALVAPASAQGVKIGILNDQSGVYADYGGKYSFEAAKMAIEDFGGSVLDHKIEIITADHQNKPDLGVSIARRWYDVEGVDMITELTTSSVALAVHELSKTQRKIDIVVGAATSRLTGDACHPYGFHWAYDTHALAIGTGGALTEAGGNTRFFLT